VPNAGPGTPGQNTEVHGENIAGPTINEMPPVEASFQASDDSVMLAGTISYSGEESGILLLQFLREESGQPIVLLHSEEREGLRDFEISVPKNLGEISAVAFLDLDSDNKPTPDDLGGRFDLVVESSDVKDIQIEIASIDSLGSLMPGSLLPGTGPDNIQGGEAPSELPTKPTESTGALGPDTPMGPPMDGRTPPPAPEVQ